MSSKFDVRFEDGLAMYDEAVSKAESHVLDMGLGIGTRPTGRGGDFAERPMMPIDLSDINFRQVQTLLGQFTGWYEYAIGQLRLAEGQRNAADKQKTYAWSKIRKTKEGTVDDKNDQVRTDSRFMQTDAHYEYCDTKVRLLQGIVDGLKRDIDTVSRTVTTIEGTMGVHGRGAAIGRKRFEGRSTEDDAPPRRTLNKGVLHRFRAGNKK